MSSSSSSLLPPPWQPYPLLYFSVLSPQQQQPYPLHFCSHANTREGEPTSPPYPPPWTPLSLPLKFLSILSIEMQCPRRDEFVLPLHVFFLLPESWNSSLCAVVRVMPSLFFTEKPVFIMPLLFCDFLRQHHDDAALHGSHPVCLALSPNMQQ